MTTKLPPGAPKLVLDGEPQEGDKLADSAWEGDEDPEDQTRENLGKIAKARKSGGSSTKG